MAQSPTVSTPTAEDVYKIHVIGNSAVGKTAIINRYVKDEYNPEFITTIGVDYIFKDVTIGDKNVRLEITDTAGQERYRAIAKAYLRSLDGILVIFDVTEQSSFDDIKMWMNQIEQNSPSNAPRLLVGNKIDKPNRVIDKETAQNYAESMNVEYFETSAKENKNIDELFVRMTELILKYKNNEEPEEKPVTTDLTTTATKKEKKGCC